MSLYEQALQSDPDLASALSGAATTLLNKLFLEMVPTMPRSTAQLNISSARKSFNQTQSRY